MSSQVVTLSDMKSPTVSPTIVQATTGMPQLSSAPAAPLEIAPEPPQIPAFASSTLNDNPVFSASTSKRAFDIVFALVVILFVAPLLLMIAIAVKLSSRGPVLFEQERVGKGGKTFTMLKFRTMRVAHKGITDKLWSGADDPRQTRVGALLRKTNLDELPQFFNVLWGDMSIVGPRPERPYFVDKFAKEFPNYRARHSGEVGITGWAQVQGCRGDTCIKTRLGYDLEYLQNRSLQFDLKIIWLTVFATVDGNKPTLQAQADSFSLSSSQEGPADMPRAA
jgi:exopolysaccharide biosynthesis polyprenyl glycosylphosphotransferase